MKIKEKHEDFRVEEITDVVPSEAGPFALYRLEKQGWSTPDALAAVRRRWKLDLRRLSYGGLKDRHATTVQYLTIFHGPRGRRVGQLYVHPLRPDGLPRQRVVGQQDRQAVPASRRPGGTTGGGLPAGPRAAPLGVRGPDGLPRSRAAAPRRGGPHGGVQ